MRFLHDLPIKRKLVIITMLATGLALTLVCAAFTVSDQLLARRDLVRDLSSAAQMAGLNSVEAIARNNPGSAEQALKTLGAQPNIIAACVYDRDGTRLATYLRKGAEAGALPARAPVAGTRFTRDGLELAQEIDFDGRGAGSIYLRSDLSELRERLARSASIFLVAMLGVGVIACAVAIRLQRVISGPISQLAAVAGEVAAKNDYSVRVAKRGNDEVGVLIDRFNEMLAQIQSRDAALQRARDELERRVEERTKELREEIVEHRRTEHERDRVFTLSLDFLCIVSFAGRFRRMNPAIQTAFGVADGEIAKNYVLEFVHPDDRRTTFSQLKQLKKGGPVVRFENRMRRADGSYCWVEWSGIPYLDEDCFYAYGRDVTELKQARDAVAAERARLKFIFEAVPVGISLVKPGDNLHLVNPAHERITGVAAADSHERGIFGRVSHPDDYQRQMEAAAPFLRGEVDSYSVEKRYLHPDGRVVWAVLTSRMFTDPVSGNKQCVTSLIDVSELKCAQEAVAAEQARLKFIFEAVPVGISLLLPGEPDVHVVNPAHERVTGIRRTQLNDPGVFDRATHPEDAQRQRALVQAYKRGEIDRFTLEKRYLHPDGRIVWASLTRRMFVDPTGRKQSVTTVVDITDLKRAQEEMARQQKRFKFIFDSAPVGFAWAIEGDLRTRIVNPELVRITGVAAEDCGELERYRRATHPDDQARQDELTRRLRAREIDHFKLEKRYLHSGGGVRWAAMTMQLLCDRATGEYQEVTTLIDITERKLGEAELEETHRQLLASSRQAGMAEVATGVLHNVGNVLNSVNVSASLIENGVRRSRIERLAQLGELLEEHAADLGAFFARDPRGRQVPAYVRVLAGTIADERQALLAEVESLRRNVEHIKDIVAMQQNYARVSGVAESVAVAELVADAIRMNASGILRDEIALVREFEAQPTVSTEKHKVLQILVNLLRNARQACEESGRADKRITVRVTADERRVTIAVSDNGVGIAPENLTRIFAHGFTTKKNGHGFGLHSGANAAREIGGGLSARSEGPGQGATFELELPLAAAMPAA